jgi:hypothetical protein
MLVINTAKYYDEYSSPCITSFYGVVIYNNVINVCFFHVECWVDDPILLMYFVLKFFCYMFALIA